MGAVSAEGTSASVTPAAVSSAAVLSAAGSNGPMRSPSGGSRGVQVSTSMDLVRWSSFERIHIRGHTSGHAPSEGDTYFFLVQPNPVHRGSLVALFPLPICAGAS